MEKEKTEVGAGGEIKRVFGSLTDAVASDIYHTNPSMAHLHPAGRRKCYQAKDKSSHSVRGEERQTSNH